MQVSLSAGALVAIFLHAPAHGAPPEILAPAWTVTSGEYSAVFGSSVAFVGDVDGDGWDDLVAGAPNAGEGYTNAANGAAALFLGPVPLALTWSFRNPPSFGEPPGDAQWAFDEYGVVVSATGDLNGDGAPEWVVAGDGWVGVYAMLPTGPSLVADFGCGNAQLEYTNDARFGQSVAVGDVNGDGYGDLVFGSPNGDDCGAVESIQIYLGAAQGMSDQAAWGFSSDGITELGHAVAAVDLDGDGFAEVVAGDPELGEIRIYAGATDGSGATPSVRSVETPGRFGHSIAAVGDVNGDGFADLAVSALPVDGAPPAVFVYAGGAFGLESEPLSTVAAQADSEFGYQVAGAGDVNGDGYADVIVGAPLYDDLFDDEGAAFVYLGGPSGLAPIPGWVGTGQQEGAKYGFAVAGGGDVNGDGLADVAVGAPWFDGTELSEGRVIVYARVLDGTVTEPCVDADADGVSDCDGDCDDGAADVFPGAIEACDGRDTSCAGAVPADEVDADGDGVEACDGDCSDDDARVSPGIDEACGDGADNDCDGGIDEDCAPPPEPGCGCASHGIAAPALPVWAVVALVALRRGRPRRPSRSGSGGRSASRWPDAQAEVSVDAHGTRTSKPDRAAASASAAFAVTKR